MEPILIKRNTKDFKHQLDFLIKQELILSYSPYKKTAYYLAGFSIITFILFLLPETKFFVILKGMLVFFTSLFWAFVFIFIATILIKKYKRIKWRNQSIEYFKKNEGTALMSFDNEKIYFTTTVHKTEINWSYYSTYSFDKDSVFIFPNHNIYEALYFSKTELGEENFQNLTTIIKENLHPRAISSRSSSGEQV